MRSAFAERSNVKRTFSRIGIQLRSKRVGADGVRDFLSVGLNGYAKNSERRISTENLRKRQSRTHRFQPKVQAVAFQNEQRPYRAPREGRFGEVKLINTLHAMSSFIIIIKS
jgi:hypothetical protein